MSSAQQHRYTTPLANSYGGLYQKGRIKSAMVKMPSQMIKSLDSNKTKDDVSVAEKAFTITPEEMPADIYS